MFLSTAPCSRRAARAGRVVEQPIRERIKTGLTGLTVALRGPVRGRVAGIAPFERAAILGGAAAPDLPLEP